MDSLTIAVNNYAQGWRPQGGITHERQDKVIFYYQALVRGGENNQ